MVQMHFVVYIHRSVYWYRSEYFARFAREEGVRWVLGEGTWRFLRAGALGRFARSAV